MMPESVTPVANHLWQSTVFAGFAALLTLAVRNNSARVRYWIWAAASFKFLIPFSLLITLGNEVHWRTAAPVLQASLPIVLDQVSEPFIAAVKSPVLSSTSTLIADLVPLMCLAVWVCGVLAIAFRWCIQWRRIARAVRVARPLQLNTRIKALCSPLFLEPAVFGVFRPILLLPQGLLEQLTPEQMKTVIAHELCHVRHRDNFVAVLQMFVETVFWFHPLVWWMGRRMFEERERACDEEVLRMGSDPATYARGILKVCELYLESPVACVAGITGANLKTRIEEILNKRGIQMLGRGKKVLLIASASIAAIVPAIVGVMNAPPMRAQAPAAAAPMFEVASVRASDPKAADTGGFKSKDGVGSPSLEVEHTRFSAINVNLLQLIVRAYGISGCPPGPRVVDCPLLSGEPDWVKKERFDIQAKMPDGLPEYTTNQFLTNQAPQLQLMIQSLLAGRFNLKVRHEKKQMSAYVLTVGKNGPKLKKPKDGEAPRGPLFHPVTQANGEVTIQMSMQNWSMQQMADVFSAIFNQPVLDRTGLQGKYDLEMEYEGNVDQPGPFTELTGPDLFTAFKEQAGLKLQGTKAPVDVLVIEHVERPSEN